MIVHISFTSVFSTTHVSLSIDFTSALAEVWSQTGQLLDRPLGAPLRRANIRSGYRPSNGSRHTRWPIHNGGIIYKVALKDKYSQGSSHIPTKSFVPSYFIAYLLFGPSGFLLATLLHKDCLRILLLSVDSETTLLIRSLPHPRRGCEVLFWTCMSVCLSVCVSGQYFGILFLGC